MGRNPTSTEELTRRGSWRGTKRKKDEAAAKNGRSGLPKRKWLRIADKKFERICRTGIPGYDPWRDADGFHFDHAAGKAAIKFFNNELTHIEGTTANDPFRLDDWEVAFIGNIYGWLRSDGSRRYREVLVYIPRKNGKTVLAAGMVLLGLFADGEAGAQIYGAAATYKQACFVFKHARGMVKANPKLFERTQIFNGQAKSLQLREHPDNVDDIGVYTPISADSAEGHGQNAHMSIVDELHLQPDRVLIDALRTATASKTRRQPLIMYLTTADYMRPSICNEIYEYGCRVRDGQKGFRDPTFLPVIYEASSDEDWTSERVWEQANPGIDVSVSRDYLRKECQRAQDSPGYENTFKRLHLNIRTESDVRWLSMEAWDRCAGPVDLDALKGRDCYAGLDLATTSDTTALVLLFPEDGGFYDLLMYCWLPETIGRKRERRDRVPYAQWIKEGLIRTTAGNTTDYAVVRRDINALADLHPINRIALDRLFQGAQLGTELQADGFDVIAFGQGFTSMAAPTKAFENAVIAGRFRHGGNAVLRWMASNVAVEIDAAGNMKPSRKKSTEKIDGIVAAIMALAEADADAKQKSNYETRGVVWL